MAVRDGQGSIRAALVSGLELGCLGTLEAEASIIEGGGSQLTNLSRWGDYSSISIDPVDDCTFWYTSEYLRFSGTFNWSTRIASFKFPSCGTAPTTDFSTSAPPPSVTVTQGNSASYTVTVTSLNNFSGDVNLSVSGLPAGATANFTPNPVVLASGSTSSTLAVATSGSTPTGTYTLTISGTSGSLSHSTTVTLVVNSTTTVDFSISASPTTRNVTRGSSTSYTVTIGASGGFTGNVTLSVTGLPASTGTSFNPNPVTGGSGSSTLTLSTSSATGSYTLTIMGASGSLSHSVNVKLNVR